MERLTEKIETINRNVGLEASILGEKVNPREFNALRRIEDEDQSVTGELDAEVDVSGEFIRQVLADHLKRYGPERLERIPDGPQAGRWYATGSRWPATASSTTLCTWSPPARPGRTLEAESITARRSGRANLARRRCGVSRGASATQCSGASWRTRRRRRATLLDKEEPRIPYF
jgi:hypothetical protein